MWKRSILSLLMVVAIGVAASLAMPQVALRRMRPRFFQAYENLREEVYAKYLSDGAMPAPSALSGSAQETLSGNKGVKYSTADGLSFTYDKPYPVNLPVIGLVTFGYCWGGAEVHIGCDERPEVIIHNAKLRAGKSH